MYMYVHFKDTKMLSPFLWARYVMECFTSILSVTKL